LNPDLTADLTLIVDLLIWKLAQWLLLPWGTFRPRVWFFCIF